MVRRAGVEDLCLILEAQKSSHFEHEPSSDMEVWEALSTGRLQVYILERRGCPVAIVGCAVEGHEALLCMFQRKGAPDTIFEDCAELWSCTKAMLQSQGIKKVAMYISMSNPKYKGLLKLYERMGFKQDMTRMSGAI